VLKIYMSIVSDIPDFEPKEKTKDTLGKHTVLKFDAQLRDEGHGEEEFPHVPPVQSDPATTSSSHSAPPTSNAMLSYILDSRLYTFHSAGCHPYECLH
jgi:hypothetical protein